MIMIVNQNIYIFYYIFKLVLIFYLWISKPVYMALFIYFYNFYMLLYEIDDKISDMLVVLVVFGCDCDSVYVCLVILTMFYMYATIDALIPWSNTLLSIPIHYLLL